LFYRFGKNNTVLFLFYFSFISIVQTALLIDAIHHVLHTFIKSHNSTQTQLNSAHSYKYIDSEIS